MHSHIYFGRKFASDPRSKITSSISYFPIYVVNLISLPIRIVCFPSFWTMYGSPGVVPANLVMSAYSPFIALLPCNSFMHVTKNVVSIDGSISHSSLSLIPQVEESAKLFLASMNVSLVRSKSNSGSFIGAL